MFLSRSGIRFLWIVLVVALVVGAWLLSSLFQTNAFNVRATVKGSPAGIVQAIAAESGTGGTGDTGTGSGTGGTGTGSGTGGTGGTGTGSEPEDSEPKDPETGSEPSGGSPPMIVELSGNQGQVLYINTDIDYGTVFPGESLTSHFIVELINSESQITYTITLVLADSYEDMRPYLTVWKDPDESETEPDDTTNGDYYAEGTLDANADPADIADKWWVTFTVPDEPGEFGEYQADIEIKEKVED